MVPEDSESNISFFFFRFRAPKPSISDLESLLHSLRPKLHHYYKYFCLLLPFSDLFIYLFISPIYFLLSLFSASFLSKPFYFFLFFFFFFLRFLTFIFKSHLKQKQKKFIFFRILLVSDIYLALSRYNRFCSQDLNLRYQENVKGLQTMHLLYVNCRFLFFFFFVLLTASHSV